MIAIIKPEDAITRELEDRMNINREFNKRIGKQAKTARMAELKAQIEDGTYVQPHPELYVDAVMAGVEDES
jgi:hypothetical protein